MRYTIFVIIFRYRLSCEFCKRLQEVKFYTFILDALTERAFSDKLN